MKRLWISLLILALLVSALPMTPINAQDQTCGNAPPSRLIGAPYAQVPAGVTAPVYDAAGGNQVGQVDATAGTIYLMGNLTCIDNTWWWYIQTGDYYDNWMPENQGSTYVLEPFNFIPNPPVVLGVPMTPPVISDLTTPLPAVTPAGNPQNIAFVPWNWQAILQDAWYTPPDPMALQLPAAYAGDLPTLPVNLDNVYFVQDANLNPQQLALLAQNGFVVIPSSYTQFDDLYYGGGASSWNHTQGKGDFITTDALLHSLYLTYQNALMFLEMNEFYGRVANFVGGGYLAAQAQMAEAVGTPLETPARQTAVYYAVALSLLADGESSYLVGYNQLPGFEADENIPSQVLAQADPSILAEAQPIIDMIRSAQGRLAVPFLDNYEEDFSQYQPRSYYAGNPLLESYFRAMMWLGRITFRAKSPNETTLGLLALRALNNSGTYSDWSAVADTLNFLVGPMDDYSAVEYLPLAQSVFGVDLPLAGLADPAQMTAFLNGVAQLPGPRINSLPLPQGTQADQVDTETRGFRLFGQRFTLDGYIMQQLIYPEVGTANNSRALPLSLDVATALGSDMAYMLADQAGATAYTNYTDHLSTLRTEVNGMNGDAWLENLYGGWLWALQPLLVRDPALVPPMMQTDAWKRKDIHSALGSWTELKHATLLYAEQPYGGLGGGGVEPPVISTSYVEPNPLVFARIAVVAGTLDQGLASRNFYTRGQDSGGTALSSIHSSLNSLTLLSARLAEIAREEIAGEPVSQDDLYWMQENFGSELWHVRYEAEMWFPDAPKTVALVADVASNPDAGTVLEEATGPVNVIYVVVSGPHGPQLTRGAVYSYYEFTQPIDLRLTDDQWRTMVDSGQTPPRPDWINLYFSQ